MKIHIEGVEVNVDDSWKDLSAEEQAETAMHIAKEKGITPGYTTSDDMTRGAASGIAGGALNIVPGMGAAVADIATAPGLTLYHGADLAAKVAGYKHAGEVFGSDKSLAEQYKPGGYLGHSAASQKATSEAVDRYLIPPPVTPEGKFTRALASAGVEALGGGAVFRVAATRQVFSTAEEAIEAARQAEAASAAQKAQAGVPMPTTGVAPRLDFQAPQAVRELGENIPLQGAYSAAAGGGAEIAEQKGAPPIVGALLGTVAAGGAHVAANAVPVVKAGAAGVKSTLDEMLSRTEDVQQRKAAEALREAAFNKPELKAWAQRAQDAEDAYADELAKGQNANPQALETLDTARREAHGELVRNSEPTLGEVTQDKGIGKLERDMRGANTADFGITNEIRREQQNAARLAEIEALGGEGRQAALLEEFRKQRAEMDARNAETEAGAQTAADTAAAQAGTGETAEAIGGRIRGPVIAAEAAATKEGNRLYGLVAKEGVTVGTGRLKAAISQFFTPSPERRLSPDEIYYSDLVRKYEGRLDFQRMQDLRSEVLSILREKDLSDVSRRRFNELRIATDAAMDDGLARAIKDDPNLFRRVGDALTAEGLPAKEGAPLGMRGRRGAERPKPTMPLSEFIAKHGGLPLDAESTARDWGNVRVKGRPLAHIGGRSIDNYWRETLIEEGYLRPDYDEATGVSVARDVDDEVRRLLEDELHGGRRVDTGEATGRALDGPEKEFADARALVADRLKREGIDNPSPSALDEAARMLVEREETHPTTAYERAVTQGEPPAAPPPGADVPFEGGGRAVEPVDEAITERQREANRFWREKVKEPYEAQPVAPVLQEKRGKFAMTEAAVPEAVFRPGNTGAEKIRAMRAAGATDDALAEAAALSFQQRVVRDGSVSPDTFRKWARDHGPAISELPRAVQQRFLSAADAAGELRRASEARQAAQVAFDKSAVGDVLGIPPQNLTKEIDSLLKDRAAAEELAARVAGNADAQAGLRRLVADHLLFQFKDASNVLSKAALTNFLTRNKPQMAAIFGEEGARRFQRLVDDIERSRKAQVTGKDPAGPGTAGDLASMAKGSVLGMGLAALGPKGAIIGGAVKVIGDALKTAGMKDVDALLAKALLDPNFARQLLTKAPALKNEKFLRGFVRSIVRPALLGAVRGGAQFEGAR